MRDYLLFRLYGPMASWGDIAVGEYRPSFAHPSKSAVLGIVSAALGITRDRDEIHQQMAESYGFAVRVDAPGTLLRDFQTVEVPRGGRKGPVLWTRKEEVEAAQADPKANPILSSRDYYCDALYVCCLWLEHPSAPYTLGQIKAALERPRFPLYLGRKSCPPALPLCPQIRKSATLRGAFDDSTFPDTPFLAPLRPKGVISIHWDSLPDPGLEAQHRITRRDVPLSRRGWQFSERHEYYVGLAR